MNVIWKLTAAGIAALLLLAIPESALALDPQRALTQAFLRKWQFPQGLPQATIFAIRQTSDRYLWLGTQAGLYRFDGIRFSAAPGGAAVALQSLWITDLCEDPEHNLWVATNDSGVVRLHDGAAVRYGLDAGLPAEQVRCLLLDRRGDLWVGTEEGAARLSGQGSRFDPYRHEQGLVIEDVRAICETADREIWFGG